MGQSGVKGDGIRPVLLVCFLVSSTNPTHILRRITSGKVVETVRMIHRIASPEAVRLCKKNHIMYLQYWMIH